MVSALGARGVVRIRHRLTSVSTMLFPYPSPSALSPTRIFRNAELAKERRRWRRREAGLSVTGGPDNIAAARTPPSAAAVATWSPPRRLPSAVVCRTPLAASIRPSAPALPMNSRRVLLVLHSFGTAPRFAGPQPDARESESQFLHLKLMAWTSASASECGGHPSAAPAVALLYQPARLRQCFRRSPACLDC